jgi:hypothetical protein
MKVYAVYNEDDGVFSLWSNRDTAAEIVDKANDRLKQDIIKRAGEFRPILYDIHKYEVKEFDVRG